MCVYTLHSAVHSMCRSQSATIDLFLPRSFCHKHHWRSECVVLCCHQTYLLFVAFYGKPKSLIDTADGDDEVRCEHFAAAVITQHTHFRWRVIFHYVSFLFVFFFILDFEATEKLG